MRHKGNGYGANAALTGERPHVLAAEGQPLQGTFCLANKGPLVEQGFWKELHVSCLILGAVQSFTRGIDSIRAIDWKLYG